MHVTATGQAVCSRYARAEACWVGGPARSPSFAHRILLPVHAFEALGCQLSMGPASSAHRLASSARVLPAQHTTLPAQQGSRQLNTPPCQLSAPRSETSQMRPSDSMREWGCRLPSAIAALCLRAVQASKPAIGVQPSDSMMEWCFLLLSTIAALRLSAAGGRGGASL